MLSSGIVLPARQGGPLSASVPLADTPVAALGAYRPVPHELPPIALASGAAALHSHPMRCLPWLAILVFQIAACSPRSSQPPLAAASLTRADEPSPLVTSHDSPYLQRCFADARAAYALVDELGKTPPEPLLEPPAPPPELEALLRKYDRAWYLLHSCLSLSTALLEVHPDPSARREARRCHQAAQATASVLERDTSVYRKARALDSSELPLPLQRMHQAVLSAYEARGSQLPTEQQRRLASIDEQLARLAAGFRENIRTSAPSLRATADELSGLGEAWLLAHPPRPDGSVTISATGDDYDLFMQQASNRGLRQRAFVAHLNVGYPDNLPVLQQLLALRHERARLLGYPTAADMALAGHMLSTSAEVDQLLEQVLQLVRAPAARDYQELLVLARENAPGQQRLELWDLPYYRALLSQRKEQLPSYLAPPHPSLIADYLPFEAVLGGLQHLTTQLFDIKYVPVDAPHWHAEVRSFDVVYQEQPLGRLHLDLHPREGKQGSARTWLLARGAGHPERTPELLITGAFPRSRLGLEPMQALFHEFGHAVHLLFSEQGNWHTLARPEPDFLEAPAQVFEEWARSYEVVRQFARHHQTGEAMPEAVFRSALDSPYEGARFAVNELFQTALVLEFHRIPPDQLSPEAEEKRVREAFTPYHHVPGSRRHLGLPQMATHPGTLHTYLWSKALAKDLFSPFRTEGALSQIWAHRYRDVVLSQSGLRPARQVVEDFLERPLGLAGFASWVRGEESPASRLAWR